ncbi:CHASE2 domain-containing protein [Chitinimonas lacunae]|uniref:CHASE2 domain-containing protein n=1 Tax=Chitinimonas lacunae TaxID=1963018 RepID=A0ABV8MUY1_9NEIS
MKTLRKNWLQILLSALLLVFLLGYATERWRPLVLERLDLWFYDTRLALTMPDSVDPRVVVVDIDEKSLAEIGRWPWRRDVVAKLVDQLTGRYQAAVVGFDIVFAEKDDSSGLAVLRQLAGNELRDNPAFQAQLPTLERRLDYDSLLAQHLRNRPVVLGYYFNFGDSQEKSGQMPAPVLPAGLFSGKQVSFLKAAGYGANLPVLTQAASAAGHFNPVSDPDGVLRRVPLLVEYQGNYYESLSLAMVRAFLNYPAVEPVYPEPILGKSYKQLEWFKVGPLRIPVDNAGSALIPYRGPQGSFTYVSAADVIGGRTPVESVAGRMVLVGTTAPGLKDLRVAPVSPVYAGVEAHANMVAGMMSGKVPAMPSYLMGLEVVTLLLVWLALLWILLRLAPLPATLSVALLLVSVLVLNFLAWRQGLTAVPLAATVTLIVLMYAISMAYGYFFVARKQKQMANLFGQYVPPELVEKMSEEPEKYSMEGQSHELTVLFSDVRSFTTISESMEPRELARFMNEFLTSLTTVIRNNHLGTIDKYMGDCVMAFWGAPVYDPDHARNAVLAGIEMQKAITELGPQLKARGWPEIHIGVGVNTGRMTVGDMGSQIRKAYTVMGDAVNLASRLEGITKQYGVGMIVGEMTRQAVREGIVFRELDRVRVKGKDEPVSIYEPIGLTEAVDRSVKSAVELFHQALKYYRAQNWDMAELQLLNLKKQDVHCKLYQVYLDRIARFRQDPPPPDWDGVYEFETK